MIADYKSLNMAKFVAWGNPYHGRVQNNVVTLPNGTTRSFTAGGECILVAINGTPAPMDTNTAEDALAGLRWDNYVLLQNPNNESYLYYPGDNAAGTQTQILVNWCYKDSTGKAWRIVTTMANYGNVSTRYVKIFGKRVHTGEAFALIGTCPVPTEPVELGGPYYNNPKVNQSPDGSKAAFVFGGTSEYGLSVVEVTASGGNDSSPPTFTSTVIVEGEDAYSITDVSTPLYGTRPLFHVELLGYIETVTSAGTLPFNVGSRREINESKVLVACYDDSGSLKIIRYTYHYLYVPFGYKGTSLPSWEYDHRDAGPGPEIVFTQTGGYDREVTRTITGCPAIVVTEHSEGTSYSTTHLPSTFIPESGTTFVSFDATESPGGGLMPFTGVPVTSSDPPIYTITPASGEFLKLLYVITYSRTVAGFGRPAQTITQNYVDGNGDPIITVPAYSALAWSVAGPKSSNSTPTVVATGGGWFPIVVHPITGEFAYGAGCGFV